MHRGLPLDPGHRQGGVACLREQIGSVENQTGVDVPGCGDDAAVDAIGVENGRKLVGQKVGGRPRQG
jgi:hypothetical protein